VVSLARPPRPTDAASQLKQRPRAPAITLKTTVPTVRKGAVPNCSLRLSESPNLLQANPVFVYRPNLNASAVKKFLQTGLGDQQEGLPKLLIKLFFSQYSNRNSTPKKIFEPAQPSAAQHFAR
jgi:hypothetical protein